MTDHGGTGFLGFGGNADLPFFRMNRKGLRGLSRTSSILAAILAAIGGGLFWRLHAVFSEDVQTASTGMLFANVLLPFLILSFGCLVISVVSILLTSRQERLISQDQGRIEATEQVAELVAKLDEEHMQSFSSWLHDSVGHGLVLIKMDIDYLLSRGRLAKADAERAAEHVDNMLAEVRGMASSLYPKILSEAGLAPALESLVGHYRRMSHIEVDSAIGDLSVADGDKRRQIVVYRTVQECLTNAAKYGPAEFVWVSVQERDGRIHGTILNHVAHSSVEKADAAESPSERVGGLGLQLMALRIRRIGGRLGFGWEEENVFKVEFAA